MSDDALPPRTSQSRPKKDAADAPAAKRPGPSLARRIISWVFILLLLALLIFEWRAKTDYEKSLAALQARHKEENEKQGELTLPEADTLVRGTYTRSDEKKGHDRIVEYRWKSFFREYVVAMTVESETDAVLEFQTGDAEEAPAD